MVHRLDDDLFAQCFALARDGNGSVECIEEDLSTTRTHQNVRVVINLNIDRLWFNGQVAR